MTIRILSIFAMIFASIWIASADELQLPPMKEGLWESHTQQVIQKNKFETVMKICQSHEFEKSMKASSEGLRKSNQCSDVVTRLSPNSYSTESHCDKGPLSGSVSKATVSFQGDTSMHMEMHMKTGDSESVTIIDSHYLGSCPADMKPGDTVMADGKKMSFGQH